jgi:hypothetical protein
MWVMVAAVVLAVASIVAVMTLQHRASSSRDAHSNLRPSVLETWPRGSSIRSTAKSRHGESPSHRRS